MEEKFAIFALSALAQESRLAVFRLLLEEGPDGLPAGEIGQRLSIPANVLSFHLTRLRHAGLVTARRNGRQINYAAHYEGMQKLMGFLTENCCRRSPRGCSSECPPTESSQTDEKQRRQMARSARRPLSPS